jgi:transposase-like protein
MRQVKQQIVEMTLNRSGIRDISPVLHVSTATVIEQLKKNSTITNRQSDPVDSPDSGTSGGRYCPSRSD